ncbi:hypothetical protein D3C86_1717560 [compost metagenome]
MKERKNRASAPPAASMVGAPAASVPLMAPRRTAVPTVALVPRRVKAIANRIRNQSVEIQERLTPCHQVVSLGVSPLTSAREMLIQPPAAVSRAVAVKMAEATAGLDGDGMAFRVA